MWLCYVCLSHTEGTGASFVGQLATCHGVIKAEQETIQTLKSEAGEERPEFYCENKKVDGRIMLALGEVDTSDH